MEDAFKEFDLKILKHDEMESMVLGFNFLTQHAKDSQFTYVEGEGKQFLPDVEEPYPKLLVSIGSGVSIIKIDGFDSFQRVSGTMIGGGTLLGLSNMLTGINDFDTILSLAEQGDNKEIDMLVRDIYG